MAQRGVATDSEIGVHAAIAAAAAAAATVPLQIQIEEGSDRKKADRARIDSLAYFV